MTRDVGKARGLLRHAPVDGTFHHARLAPSPMLADRIAHFWSVGWDLHGGPPQRRETLPHPTIHIVLQAGRSRVHGIERGRFTTVLEGRGSVFGVKLRPGGFRGLLGRAVATLRGTSLPLDAVFGGDAATLEARVFDVDTDAARVAILEDLLTHHLPPADDDALRLADLVEAVATDPTLLRTDVLAHRAGTTPRGLQRLFHEYVGVTPKWVINRYRLHEALERLDAGEPVSWTSLALDLGYFDQPHFIRDFKAMVGCTPGAYARRAR